MPPLISIVIPTFNRPAFLDIAMRSVEAARIAAGIGRDLVEVIVVDDGHDENSRKICESLKSELLVIRYLVSVNGPRAGPSVCRDQGIKNAIGKLIYLLDDDDAFLPNRFLNSLRLLTEGGFDLVLESSLREYVNHIERSSFITGPYDNPSNAFYFLMTGGEKSHISPGATSFKKLLYERVGGYDKTLRYGEDGELLLRFCLSGRVALVGGEPVVRVAIHEDNSSRPNRIFYWHNIKSLARLYKKMLLGPWREETVFVKSALSGKFDYALSEIRRSAPSYYARLSAGLLVLKHFDWRCAGMNNMKSIVVWLFKSRHS